MSIQKVPKSFYLALVELSGVLCLCLGHMREQLLSRSQRGSCRCGGGGHHTPPAAHIVLNQQFSRDLHPSHGCCFCHAVPVDVFSPNSEWSGFYEYLGKRQATTFTVTGFNASSSRVNVTLLETSGVSIRLSGKNRLSVLTSCPHQFSCEGNF